MSMFRNEMAAVGAARRLQEEIAAFGVGRTRLTPPFRLRGGIGVGEVVEEGADVGETARAALGTTRTRTAYPREAGQAMILEKIA